MRREKDEGAGNRAEKEECEEPELIIEEGGMRGWRGNEKKEG